MELYMYESQTCSFSVVEFAAVRRLSRRQALGVLCARCAGLCPRKTRCSSCATSLASSRGGAVQG